MFLKTPTMKSTENYSDKPSRLKDEIATADAIIIGAGAGLSASAGFDYSVNALKNTFPIFTKNTVSPICTRADSIRLKRLTNTGRGGHGIFS